MPPRVLIAKPGLDGHDRGAKVVARALRDAGCEVIYTGLHQTPEQIVELLAARDAADIVVFGGGIIPEEDIPALEAAGLARIFTPGAPLAEITSWVEQNLIAR